MKSFIVLVFLSLSHCLMAGEWTLIDGVLTSSDGKWSFSSASISGTTLAIGSCTKWADDGILDFRSAVVNDKSISLIKFADKNITWGSIPIVDFYCDKIDKINASLFSGNTSLKRFYAPSMNNRSMPANAFFNCTSLTNAYFGGPITSIAIDCFSGCANLEANAEEFISPNISSLATRAFKGCKKLCGKLVLKNINGFSSAGDCFNGSGLEEVVIQSENDLFSKFSTSSFGACTSLTNVTIKSTKLVAIPKLAIFNECTSIMKVTLDIPNVSSSDAGNASTRMFNGCKAISEVRLVNKPWKNSEGNSIVTDVIEKHILYSVPAVGHTTDAPKKCTIYAKRKDYAPFADALASAYEKNNAPKRCYGVFVTTEGQRKAYMAQPPDYFQGMSISVQ